MKRCNQNTITDKAFINLRGIHTLNIFECNQKTITDKAFIHLKGIHTLNMNYCSQNTITDKAFQNLERNTYFIHEINVIKETITD